MTPKRPTQGFVDVDELFNCHFSTYYKPKEEKLWFVDANSLLQVGRALD